MAGQQAIWAGQGRQWRQWRRGFRALMLASVFTLPAAAQQVPQGGTVAVGAATITAQGAQTLINQTSNRALIDWRSFDIGAGASVQVVQPGAASILVNRVTGNGIGTRIDGSLSANGQVVVIDKAGVVIGRGARVDAGSFLATTADIDNADFAAGRLIFGKAGQAGAAIVNDGTINVADGGYAVLAGASVRNSGVVSARLGRVVLAGTERFTLDLAGDGLLRFELPSDVAGRLVNDGTVTGAQVLMTARAARNGMAGVVNVGGLVEATSAMLVDGRIIIGGDGSDTAVTGQVRAAGGQVDIQGGSVTLTGADVDVSSAQGDGGHIRVGGDFQGKGDLERARLTRVDGATTLRADGAAGGRVIVWSDGHTDFAGTVSARGAGGGAGGGAGDGGFAEVSGKGSLRFAGTADLSGGAGGKAGELLLDPTNITIGTVADVDGTGSQGDDIPNSGSIGSGAYGAVTSLITASAIANLLNNGTSVTLSASNDINVNSAIAQTSGRTTSLSLNAGRDLTFADGVGVTSSSGSLSMNFQAGRSVTATSGSFTSRGGAISITGSGGGTTGIGLSGVSINAGSGNITLSGTGTGTGVSLDSSSSLISSFGNISVTGTGVNGIVAQGSSVVRAGSGDVTLTGTGDSGGVGLSISGGVTMGGAAQSGTVSLRADDMALTGAVIRSSGTVNLRTRSNNRRLLIGEVSDSAAGLALSTTELGTVTAGTLSLGYTRHTATVTVSANPSASNIGALELLTSSLSLGSASNGLLETFLNAGKNATVETSGAISVTNNITKNAGADATLTLRAGGNLSFGNGIGASASQGRLNMDFTGGYSSSGSLTTSGSGAFTSNGGSVTLTGRSGLTLSGSSVAAGAGTIILSGGDIALSGTSITSTGRVQVRPFATGGQMDVGATGAGSGVANVSQAELNQISAGILRIGALDGGNMVISDTLSHASNVVELASAGTVTQSANINVTNLALLGSGGNFTLTRSGNAVSTIAANTGSFDFHSGSSLSVGTVAGTTGVTFTGDATLYAHAALMTLGQTATYAGSGRGTLTLSGDIDLAVSANAGVSGSGRLNIVLAADGNAAVSPGYVAISNATLSTNGGDITIGSGSTPASRAAVGKAATGIGVNITASTLNSGSGGNILIKGEGAVASGDVALANANTGIGINVSASTIQATGSGTITLNGAGGAGNSLTAGVAIGNGSTVRSASGAIAINGAQAATGTSRYGILLRDDPGTRSAIFSTSSGGVELKATGTAGRIAANGGTGDSSRAYIGWDGSNAYGGTVTLTADAMELTSATGTGAISIGGSGNLVLRPLSTGAGIAIGTGAVGASDLELTQAELDTLRAGFSSVTVGRSDGTGAVSVAGAAFKDNVTIQGGSGAVTVSGALTTTGSRNDAGTLSLQTTGLLSISAGISTQNQNITLTADRLALTGTVNAGTGTVTLTNATASRAIDIGSTTNAANALEISAAELNQVTAGVIRVGADNSGAISITQAIAPTGTSNLHLRSGAGITQNAGITVTNLAVTAGGDVALSSPNNAVTGFAASTSNDAVSLRDDTGFAIASIDGVAGVSIGTGNLSLTSTGTVTQTAAISAAGLLLTGTGGTYTLAHASQRG